MKRFQRVVFAAVPTLALAAAPAVAHHSTTGMMNEHLTEITGTVKEFQFQNPHSWIQMLVPDASGQEVEWSVEWGIPNSLLRQGYSPMTFPEGAEVTVRLNQIKSGAPMGEFHSARFPDGKTVGRWDEAEN